MQAKQQQQKKVMKNARLNLPEKKFTFFLPSKLQIVEKTQNWKIVYNKIIKENVESIAQNLLHCNRQIKLYPQISDSSLKHSYEVELSSYVIQNCHSLEQAHKNI